MNLRKKSAAITATKQFLAFIENQFETKVQAWMSDAGGEYKSDAFTDMLKDRGIRILQSAPYTHQQNGHAERFIRTLMEKAEAMRLEACLPKSWWEYATMHACHVYNRTPMHRLNWCTPYERLHGEQPRIDHLRIFGCGAWVHLSPEVRKDKLSPKAELMTYVGVAPGRHGYIRTLSCTCTSGPSALWFELFVRPYRKLATVPNIQSPATYATLSIYKGSG